MSNGRDRALAIVLYVITALYMVMIFYFSSQSQIAQPGPLSKVPEVDKFEHASEYLVLGLLLFLSFQHTSSRTVRQNSWPLALLIAVLYAMSDETHQLFVPGRVSDLLDLLADTTGTTIGCLIGAWSYEMRSLSKKGSQEPSVELSKNMTDSEE